MDIVLVLPQSLQLLLGTSTKRFTSQVRGTICDHEFDVHTQPLYPWLDGNTFNKWFVPDGMNVPLSLLPIADAERHDFRAGGFNDMLEFLEEHHYIKRHTTPTTPPATAKYTQRIKQASLFLDPLLFVLCGPTCAGKSTLAEFVTKTYNYYYIEASDYMHLSFYRSHGVGSSVRISDFAQRL